MSDARPGPARSARAPRPEGEGGAYGDLAESPAVLPSFVSRFSVSLPRGRRRPAETDGAAWFPEVSLPAELQSASPKRQLEFAAGRHCARRALERLGFPAVPVLPIGRGRAPEWPPGVIGSITHTDGFASAAAASGAHLAGLGIDSEPVMEEEQVREIAGSIATAAEIAGAASATLCERRAVTLIFSAKEAVFKSLFPRVGRYFGWFDVWLEVTADAPGGAGRFRATVTRGLGGDVGAGVRLRGRFQIADGYVHTGTLALIADLSR